MIASFSNTEITKTTFLKTGLLPSLVLNQQPDFCQGDSWQTFLSYGKKNLSCVVSYVWIFLWRFLLMWVVISLFHEKKSHLTFFFPHPGCLEMNYVQHLPWIANLDPNKWIQMVNRHSLATQTSTPNWKIQVYICIYLPHHLFRCSLLGCFVCKTNLGVLRQAWQQIYWWTSTWVDHLDGTMAMDS